MQPKMPKIGVIAYVPPIGQLHSQSFVDNILKFPPKNPLFLISDDVGHNPSRLIKSPEQAGRKPPWALNNLCFFRGLEMARDAALDYFCYLEVDSRVGCAAWDERLFAEFFTRYPDGIACAGCPVVWDLNAGGREFALRVLDETHAYRQASGLPASFYSSKNPLECSGGAYYPNGSCGVYQTAAMLKVFSNFELDVIGYARHLTAWDLSIGRFLFNYHGPRAPEHVGYLTSAYSGFGDCTLNYEERKERLVSGKVVLIHQCKDEWTP